MKKFFALIIAFFMLFAFVGCDNSTEFDFELRFNKIFEDVDVDNVTSDLQLPTSIGSLTIVWESSNTDVLSNDGKIFNTTGEVISVTLTAHMQHEKEKSDLSKDLKIAPTGGIKDILEGETGTYKIKGTVVAINARSFIISDGTNGILVFKGGSWACDVEIGEVLELSGETTKYPTSLTEGVGVQFGQDAGYKRVSTGTYTYPVAKELKAADVENYAKEKIIKPEYVKLTGKLSVSDKGEGKVFYNLVIDGTKIKGSLAYPTNSEELKALDGKNVEVYGYIVYGTGSTSVNFLNIVSTEVKEVGGSVVEPEPEPITGDVVLDFVKNFGTYAGSWSTSYEPKTITGKDLGLNNSIKVVISIANKQKDDQPIADRPVIAVGKKGIEQTVVVSGFEGKLKDVTFNLKQWNEKKKFDSIIIEYSEDGTTWTKASDDAISGGSSAIATNQEVKSNVDLSTAKYIRLYIKADSSSNQQLGLTSISLNFEK